MARRQQSTAATKHGGTQASATALGPYFGALGRRLHGSILGVCVCHRLVADRTNRRQLLFEQNMVVERKCPWSARWGRSAGMRKVQLEEADGTEQAAGELTSTGTSDVGQGPDTGFRPTGPACPLGHPNWESPTGQVGECESKEAGKEVLAAKGTLVDLSEDGMIAQEQREKQARARVWTNLDEALKQRSDVYRLDLSRQRLTRVPAEIGKLNKVETCSLADNELTEASLPEEFCELDRLRVLNLSHNRFTTLPACLCTFLDLENLDITGVSSLRQEHCVPAPRSRVLLLLMSLTCFGGRQ